MVQLRRRMFPRGNMPGLRATLASGGPKGYNDTGSGRNRAPSARLNRERGVALAVASLAVVIHERLGVWARHLRPRLLAWPVRWVETRSTADLEAALVGLACPIVLIDLGRRVRAGLEDLDRAAQATPNALCLVLDPAAHEGVATLARELGATHVFTGPVTPPEVARLLERWLPLAQRQSESDGWSNAREPKPEPEPWNWLVPLLAIRPGPVSSPNPYLHLHPLPVRTLRP